jgi:hypothetical protein
MNITKNEMGHLEMVNETQEAETNQTSESTELIAHERRETNERPGTELARGDARPPEIDGVKLLEELRTVMNRYVVLPPMAAEALALWVVHTYAFTLRNVTAYIGVVSPQKRCGKTTLLTLLGTLAHRSLMASNISASALFRVIEETQPTLLIDEADTFLQTRDELRGILNAGYNREGAYVVRVATNRGSKRKQTDYVPQFGAWTNENVTGSSSRTELAQYSCWCPKVMAAIGRLPDTMQRKTAAEQCERMRNLDAASLRSECAQFVGEHSEEIRKAQPSLPTNLNDRAADIWEPLLAIADIAGGDWPKLAREAALKLSAGDEEPSLLGYFLQDVKVLFVYKQTDRLFSRDIVEMLEPFHDRPWEDLRRGREINEWWLGQRLREVGIRSRTIWIGEMSAKGYMLEDFEEAVGRYSLPLVQELIAGKRKPDTKGTNAESRSTTEGAENTAVRHELHEGSEKVLTPDHADER